MLRYTSFQYSALLILLFSLVSCFSQAQTLYWIGGSGNFNDQQHWSFESGGLSSHVIPSESSKVCFDDNSGKGFVTIAFGQLNTCGSLNTQNTKNKLIFTGAKGSSLTISGSLNLSRLADFRYKGSVLFHSLNKSLQEVDFGKGELSADVSFDQGSYRINSLHLSPSATLSFGSGYYLIENAVLSAGSFINENKNARFQFKNAYLKVASDFKIMSEQDFSSANLYLMLENTATPNPAIPLSLLSAKNFTSVNSTNVVCPVTITTSPACTGTCTGVLTVSLSTTCTNTPYSVFVTNAYCPTFTAVLSNTNIPTVFTVTNACACSGGNYVVMVRDASNTIQAASSGVNFVPTSALIFDSNINPCLSSCNGSLRGTILGASPFTVSVISSSTTLSTFTTVAGDYTLTNVCAGNYSFVITDVGGCTTLIPQTLVGASGPLISANSGSICSGEIFNLSPTGATSYTITGGTSLVSPTVTTSYTVLGSNSGGCPGSFVSTVSVSASPLVSAPNGTICNGSSFTLNPSGANTYTYAGGNPVVSPSVTSNYSVSGTSTNGCSSGTLVIVTVNQLPTVTVNSGSICSGSSFTITPGGASTYTYSSGQAIVSPTSTTIYSVTGTSSLGCVSAFPAISNVSVSPRPVISVNSGSVCFGSSFTLSPLGALIYTISGGSTIVTPSATTNYSVIGAGVNGCISLMPAISGVSVIISPVTTITANSPICEGKSLNLQATVSGAVSYFWNGPMGFQSLLQNPAISPVILANSGAYTLSTSFNYGSLTCSTSTSYSVQVLGLPVISAANATICAGQQFVINASGAISYVYSSGTPSVSPLVSSIYTVVGTAVNTCTNFATVSVLVNPSPIIQVNSGTLCVGNSFTLVPSGASSYTFTTGSAVISPTTSLAYSVSGTNSLGCVSFSPATGYVTVYPSPGISPYSTSSLICVGESATLSAIGLPTYTWSNGLISHSIVVSPGQSTTYTLTGTDNNGCSSVAQFLQNVDACLGLSTLGIDGFIKVFPNPFKEECMIETLEEMDMIVVNTLGQFMCSQRLVTGKNRTNLSSYPAGIYFIQLKLDVVIRTIKVIKE